MLGKWRTGIVESIKNETSIVKRFFVRVAELDGIDFKPGQFVTFDLPIHEKRTKRWRSYSIASAPGPNLLEFVIVRLENGAGSGYLFDKIKEGSEITLRDPQGVFTLPKVLEKECCFICTGTGVAPFRSMLLDFVNKRQETPSIHLIFGTRTTADLLYAAELNELAASRSNWHYHQCLSREDTIDSFHGYVHPVYERLFADKRAATFYLCGWRDMIDEARTRIVELGYDRKDVVYEIYG